MEDKPVYQITIDPKYSDGEELGIDMIAFTSNPAIKVKGMAFTSEEKKPMMFKDDVKMRIAAPAMIPMHIYRRDEEDGKEYYVQFTEEVIEQLHTKFMHNLNNKDLFNVEHEESLKAPAYILEAWIVDDPKKDKSLHTYNTEVPKGSLFVVAQVTNRKYYDALVEQGRIGFSIEGFLGMKMNEIKEQFNNEQMKKETYELEGKFYEVIDGKLSEVVMESEEEKEEEVAMESEEEKPEEMMEEPKEEAMEEEVKEEVEEPKEEAMEVDPEADAEAIIGVVTPLLDAFREEILELLAEMKNENQPDEVVEEEMAATKLSAHQAFQRISKFLKN